MKKIFPKSALAVLASGMLATLAGCGNVSRDVAKDGLGASELVWPSPNSATPMHRDGTWPTLDGLRNVQAGMGKQQVAALIGYPHFSEGVFGVREWNYLFHFRTKDNPDMTCQYKVLFDDHDIARSFWWKPESCADLLKAKKPHKPRKKVADEHYRLSSDALFAFGKSSIGDITPNGRERLDMLAARIKSEDGKVGTVRVIGYTDRLGSEAYNDALSQRRANAVMAYLIEQGVPSALVMAEGRGAKAPVTTDCHEANRAVLIACLAPNRRVEVTVTGWH